MKLMLRRDEKKNFLGITRYDLFAKLDVSPEEETLIRKSNPEQQYLWEGDPVAMASQHRWSMVKALPLAFVVASLSMLLHPVLFFLVGPIAWFVIGKMIFKRHQDSISVADLLVGRTIHCKDMMELMVKEDALRKNASAFSHIMTEGMRTAEAEVVNL